MDGVLCTYRIERRLALLASWCGQSPDAIHAAIWRSGFEDEAERGVMSADDYLQGFGQRLGYPLTVGPGVGGREVAFGAGPAVVALARPASRWIGDRVTVVTSCTVSCGGSLGFVTEESSTSLSNCSRGSVLKRS